MKRPGKIFYYIAIGLFVISLLLGYQQGISQPEVIRQSTANNPFFDLLAAQPAWVVAMLIFLNNAVKAFLAMLFGFFFALSPLFFIYVNGLVIGQVAALAKLKVGWAVVLAGLLPHGVFELSAMIISAAFGIWLGYSFLRYIFYHENFIAPLKYSLLVFTKKILLLLAIGAIVEAYVTPILIALALR